MFGSSLIRKIIPSKHERELKRLQPMVDAVNALEPKIEKKTDAELKAMTATSGVLKEAVRVLVYAVLSSDVNLAKPPKW